MKRRGRTMMKTATQPASDATPSLARFVLYFLKLGTFGFGGPIALAGYMQHDLVDERRWITREDYLDGLALAQLAPGPLAAQLAMYLGYVRAGFVGATLVGIAFILPSFVMVLAIAMAYVRFGGLSWMQSAFYGIGAAVIGIISRSAVKLSRMTLGKDRLLWAIFAALAISTAWTEREIIWLFLLGGMVALVIKSWPMRQMAGSAPALLVLFGTVPTAGRLGELFLYFAKAGMFVFGSGLAIVPSSLRRSGAGAPLAHRPAVCGRGRRGHDHARPGRHHSV